MEELQIILNKREIAFNHNNNRIRCFPHIINRCVDAVLRNFTNPDLVDDEDWDVEDQDDAPAGNQTIEEALARDPIALGRKVVTAMRASGQRRDRFENLIRDGNTRGWFKEQGEVIQLDFLQLLHDVRTRWDSVYKMIHRLRTMRPVSSHLSSIRF